MKVLMSMAVAAAILGGAALVTGPANAADVTVAVGQAPVVAFGYNDGYWDREHKWHDWRNHEEMSRWQTENHDHFYEKKHVELPNGGWREERYWESR